MWLCLGILLILNTSARAARPLYSTFRPNTVAFRSSPRLSEAPLRSPLLLTTRGGSDFVDDEYDEEDIADDDEALFDDFDMGDEGEDDFAEENTVDRLIQAYKKTPPLTKGYLTASFIATAAGYVLNNNDFPTFLALEWSPVLKRLQIWRPFTAFLNFGPFGLGYLLTVNFVWTYMGTLERLHHHKPYDFWIMIVFGMLSMVVGYPQLKLSPRFLGHNLSTFLVYVWSRYHEGMEVNMFELFNTRAELLPWFFLAQVRKITVWNEKCWVCVVKLTYTVV
jgi:Derlin-2/3